MEIKTKEELFQVIQDLQAKNSELEERIDGLKPTKKEPKDEEKENNPEEKERTKEELDEIEKMLSE